MTGLQPLDRAVLASALLAALGSALALRGVHQLHHARGDSVGATFVATAPTRGVLPMVTSLRAGGPAERAGLLVGDLVERIDGRAPATLAEVQREMATHPLVKLVVRRGARDLPIEVRGQ
ncbi:PDZ domain-containing protein [Sphingomonas citri]|jgi:S1-C subfamily serine protease|uniref:PDZ domain-containing protein n=1 Tax=Sphingomonas citri TaxID=2862499 RepID=A0ABS7BM82_9SPHN|nr:PDZ domain-containing protein [Sphingomonas citri]MBW6530732.1 PDZ domain-containing protein [Sphingomonas citri]